MIANRTRTPPISRINSISSPTGTVGVGNYPTPRPQFKVRSTSQQSFADNSTNLWVIRRWVSPVDGSLRVEYDYSQGLSGGDGTTAHLYHNGVEVDTTTAAGGDRSAETRSVIITGVKPGDTIDLAVDPTGPGGDPAAPDGEDDRASVDVRIHRIADLGENITTDVRDQMIDVNSTSYLRIPFTVDDLGDLDEIYLDIKYDDGFVAYVNGFQIASANAPDPAAFDSTSDGERSAEDATLFETFDITDRRSVFTLGTNYLQIRGLNSSAGDDEFLILPQMTIGTLTAELDSLRYFGTPTPGATNGLGASAVGPLVVDSDHSPSVPTLTEPIVVTAAVSETFNAINDVSLTYRVMYGDNVTITMADDGVGDDVAANDGIYTATIPAGVAQPGEMVRWMVSARDTNGLQGRFPVFESGKDESWTGTIIEDPTVSTNLPVFNVFMETYRPGSTGSIFYNGELYTNVSFTLHGQSTSGFSTTKKSLNVDFPNDHRFQREEGAPRVDDINLLTNWADKSKLRNTLGYEQRAMSGRRSSPCFPRPSAEQRRVLRGLRLRRRSRRALSRSQRIGSAGFALQGLQQPLKRE